MSNENTSKLSKKQKQVAWRRRKIFEILVRGTTNSYQIAEEMGISQSTVIRDVQFLRLKAIDEMKIHIHERLPWEYRICSEGISEVLRHAWSLIHNKDTKANKTATLH